MTEPEPFAKAELNAPIEVGEDGQWRHPDGRLATDREAAAAIWGQREAAVVANGGWFSPSSTRPDIHEGFILEIPEIQVARGGIDATIPLDRPKPVIPPRDPRGHWEYGVDTADYDDGDTEPEIVSGTGTYYGYQDRFESLQEAAEHHPGGKVYQRWVPARSPWIEVKP